MVVREHQPEAAHGSARASTRSAAWCLRRYSHRALVDRARETMKIQCVSPTFHGR
jgi:hypothetical protein